MQRKTGSFIYVLFLSLTLGLTAGGYSQVDQSKTSFRSPLNIDLFLSGNFAEVRSNHLHSGIDIKTLGHTGEPVFAVEDAYVSRIKVEPGGYGKAVYLKHPNGYSSVYGHLKEYNPALAKYVKEQQYRLKSFRVDLFPKAGAFKFKKGEIIAYSGNSGSSEGPHLHFELRDSETENPLNPLLFPFDVKDTRPPVIYSINLYSLNGRQSLKNPVKLRVSGSNGRFYISNRQVIPVDEFVGFGIETIDFLNGSSNKCGVYSIMMYVDDKLYFHSQTDEFSFAESRYINSFIDYKEYQEKRSSMYKTFIDPNNQLSIFQFAMNKGVINFEDEEIHKIRFETEDVSGNLSTLEFKVRKDTTKFLITPEQLPLYSAYFHYAEANHFEEENLIIQIPSRALYTNLYFSYESKASPSGTYSRLHMIHNKNVALHKSYKLSIKPDHLPEELKPYAVIARLNKDNQKSSIGGSWDNDYLVASTRIFGNYAIAVDTIPPVIKPRNFTRGKDLLKAGQIKFTISDDFSGILSYRGEIDGKWVLFEWDPKNRLLYHDLSYRPLDSTIPHILNLEVVDGRGNKQRYSIDIK